MVEVMYFNNMNSGVDVVPTDMTLGEFMRNHNEVLKAGYNISVNGAYTIRPDDVESLAQPLSTFLVDGQTSATIGALKPADSGC